MCVIASKRHAIAWEVYDIALQVSALYFFIEKMLFYFIQSVVLIHVWQFWQFTQNFQLWRHWWRHELMYDMSVLSRLCFSYKVPILWFFGIFCARISNYAFVLISKISPGVKKDPFLPRKGYKNVSADGGLRKIPLATSPRSYAAGIVCSLSPMDGKHLYPSPYSMARVIAFTIVLHKRLSAYLFQAVHRPVCIAWEQSET